LSYDLLNDIAPVALLSSNPQLMVTGKAATANNLAQLIAWLRTTEPRRAWPERAALHVAGLHFQKLTEPISPSSLSRHKPRTAGLDRRTD
jgi:tripartite-type tricarboxylate transporter receptor subunit TctC